MAVWLGDRASGRRTHAAAMKTQTPRVVGHAIFTNLAQREGGVRTMALPLGHSTATVCVIKLSQCVLLRQHRRPRESPERHQTPPDARRRPKEDPPKSSDCLVSCSPQLSRVRDRCGGAAAQTEHPRRSVEGGRPQGGKRTRRRWHPRNMRSFTCRCRNRLWRPVQRSGSKELRRRRP